MREQVEKLAREKVQLQAENERLKNRCKSIEKQLHGQSVKMVKMRLGLEYYGGPDCGMGGQSIVRDGVLARKILSEIKDN